MSLQTRTLASEAAPLTFSQLQSDLFKNRARQRQRHDLQGGYTFPDRLLAHKVLLSGQSNLKLARSADIVDINDSRPSQGQARTGGGKVLGLGSLFRR